MSNFCIEVFYHYIIIVFRWRWFLRQVMACRLWCSIRWNKHIIHLLISIKGKMRYTDNDGNLTDKTCTLHLVVINLIRTFMPTDPVYIQGPNLAIAVLVDVILSNGARASAGIQVIRRLYMIHSKLFYPSMIMFVRSDVIFKVADGISLELLILQKLGKMLIIPEVTAPHHGVETFSALVAVDEGNPPVNSPHKVSVGWIFDIFVILAWTNCWTTTWVAGDC